MLSICLTLTRPRLQSPAQGERRQVFETTEKILKPHCCPTQILFIGILRVTFYYMEEYTCVCLNILYLCNDELLPSTVKPILIKPRLYSSFLVFILFVFSFFFLFWSDTDFVNAIFGISFIKLHCFV